MKTVAIERFGGPEQLVKRGFPGPQPLDDEVLIKVIAAGVSRLDASACRGEARDSVPVSFPWVPGFEIAGVVDQLGPGSRRFRTGDRVYASLPNGGGYAQFATVSETRVAPMPASLLFEEAAALPLDGFAAWRALFGDDEAAARPASVQIRGASTGAGHLAVQIALAAGARVFVQAPESHRAFVEKLGRVEWVEGEAGAERRIDASTSEALSDGWVDLRGGGESEQIRGLRSEQSFAAAQGLASMIEQRRVRPRLFKILNIGQVSDALHGVESSATSGKLVLTL
jgi:NADPH:quinone reductase-like Zn-dependent oxidoreductase